MFLFLEYKGERNLHEILSKERFAANDWTKIKNYAINLITAVGHMHQRGYIHGDIKVTSTRHYPCPNPTYPISRPALFKPSTLNPTLS